MFCRVGSHLAAVQHALIDKHCLRALANQSPLASPFKLPTLPLLPPPPDAWADSLANVEVDEDWLARVLGGRGRPEATRAAAAAGEAPDMSAEEIRERKRRQVPRVDWFCVGSRRSGCTVSCLGQVARQPN